MRSADGVRFLADSNVGRLARWLRVLGYDAAFEPRLSDGLLVFRALREGRVLLTRDVELTRRRLITTGQVEAVLLTGDQVQDQLRQVRQELDLDDGAAMSRCLECNVPLQQKDPATVAHRVPPYVRATQQRFSEC
ncbi:MAG TPA: Mut7-C RNAse domain-containing protein, partial [Candidatus Binatia bacterium]|nr:Mut7-C RNAse domain-containing protein [Candidatus Binatia bacterium]